MNDADRAFDAAKQEFARVQAAGEDRLHLSGGEFKALTRLPAEIGEFRNLKFLDLSDTQISDIAVLANLTGLRWLSLGNTQVSDISGLANLTELEFLDLRGTKVTDISCLSVLTKLEEVALVLTNVADVSPLAGLVALKTLVLHQTKVVDLSSLSGLKNLTLISISDTNISDISVCAGFENLLEFYLSNSQVADIAPLAGLRNLNIVDLSHTRVSDLRPLCEIPRLNEDRGSFSIEGTPALEKDPELARLHDMDIADLRPQTREQAILAHLRSLPPWPEPLPQDLQPEPANPDTISDPVQDPTLPLIWGENGFDFLAAQIERDPVVDACIEELHQVLDILIRKGNQHDDLHSLASKAQKLLEDDPPKAVTLHLKYQAFNRLLDRADKRTEKFDDETIAALGALQSIVPGITLGHPDVQNLIARQEADKGKPEPDVGRARERAMLDRMAEPNSPFSSEVRDIAAAAAEPGADDRLQGTGPILSRNGIIAALGFVVLSGATSGVIGGGAWEALVWAFQNSEVLKSLALSMGDDVYWWARTALDKIKALLESRTPGP